MARRRSKSEKLIHDKSRPWPERIAAARKAVQQMPGDWKRDLLQAFLREVEEELVDRESSSPAAPALGEAPLDFDGLTSFDAGAPVV